MVLAEFPVKVLPSNAPSSTTNQERLYGRNTPFPSSDEVTQFAVRQTLLAKRGYGGMTRHDEPPPRHLYPCTCKLCGRQTHWPEDFWSVMRP
jgi:hypothetical protein